MNNDAPIVVWFRQDLRLSDHPALSAAVAQSRPIIPVYIWAPEEESPWPPGAASRWWLHHSLSALDKSLCRHHSQLILRRGESLAELRTIIAYTGAKTVYWHHRCEPAAIARDRQVRQQLEIDGVTVHTFNGELLYEPQAIANRQGQPYKVFTAYWNACQDQPAPDRPIDRPTPIISPKRWPASVDLAKLNLLPTRDWDRGLAETWKPGEEHARQRLELFLADRLADYPEQRDRPADPGTSFLSPYLHFGEISPRQVYHAVQDKGADSSDRLTASGESFLRELGWREFAHHLLFHFPQTSDQPLREKFADFPWSDNRDHLIAWQRGQTGYPLIDAGMAELWRTGWMHNRVRMAVGSFLVKDLRIPWQEGARWFWDTLVDADLANNSLNWQWVAGCGADAAPFFRIFNPTSQARKFDPDGRYIHRWLPELRRLDASEPLFEPWKHPAEMAYPQPIVDHAQARQQALQAWKGLRDA